MEMIPQVLSEEVERAMRANPTLRRVFFDEKARLLCSRLFAEAIQSRERLLSLVRGTPLEVSSGLSLDTMESIAYGGGEGNLTVSQLLAVVETCGYELRIELLSAQEPKGQAE